MPELRNVYFSVSPLTIELMITSPPDDEGWRTMRLTLFVGADRQHVVASCTGAVAYEFELLTTDLNELADGTSQSVSVEFHEMPFTIRGSRLATGRIELIWIVDVGDVESGVGTDTGVGMLVVTEPNELKAFVAQVERDGR